MGGNSPFFWGDAREGDWVPLDFLKSIQQTFKENQSDKFKKEKLANCLATNSVAKEWYDTLGPAIVTWDDLVKEFKRKWPKEKVVAVTIDQRRNELRKEVLREEDMEKRVTVNGVEMSGRAAWALKIGRLAALANDSGGALIGPIRDMMPFVLRKLVVGEFSTWPDFCDAVRKVDDRELRMAMEEETRFTNLERENQDLRRKVETRAPPPSPMSSIARQMGSFTLGRPTLPMTPQTQPLQNPFQGGRMSSSNLFALTPTRTWEERSIQLAKSTTGMVHHADDEKGRIAYNAKVAEWRAANPAKRGGDEYAPFPLTPGTSSVGSGECYRCGHTHQWRNGELCTRPEVPKEEQFYRGVASKIICSSRQEVLGTLRTTPAAVSAVHAYDTDDFIFIPATNEYPDHFIKRSDSSGIQGNGRGPTA